MRIALLSSFFPPNVQFGIARYVEDLAFGLTDRGLDVTIITIGPETKFEKKGELNIYWIKEGHHRQSDLLIPSMHFLKTSIRMHRVLQKLHQTKPFDIIEYPNTEFNGLGSLLLGLPAPKPTFVIRMATPRSISPKRKSILRITEYLEAWQARLSDAFISHSHANLATCEREYKLTSTQPRCVILPGLPDLTNKPQKLIHSGIKQIILFLGRMNKRKGFDILASAWPDVAQKLPNAYLSVAGQDLPTMEGKSFFEEAVKNMPAFARERLNYHGVISSEFRDFLYQEAHLCVMPSRYESFGLVLLESMRFGLPIVSTNIGGIPEVIQNGRTGVLVPPEDPVALGTAIITLLKNPNIYEQIRTNALDHFQNKFTLDRFAEQTEIFYRSIIQRNQQ